MIIAVIKRFCIQNPGAGDIISSRFDKIQRINYKPAFYPYGIYWNIGSFFL